MILKNELKSSNEIKALSFDIDGTLTRWTSVPALLQAALSHFDVEYNDGVMQDFFKAVGYYESHLLISGIANEDEYAQILGMTMRVLKENHISGRSFKDAMFYEEAYYTTCEEGIQNELARLSERYKLFCYTNWFKFQAFKKLERHQISDYFEKIYSFDNAYIKFSCVGFKSILLDYNLEPSQMVHIGDSSSDLVCKLAGIPCVLIDYEGKNAESYPEADVVVTEFKDISRALIQK